MRSRTLLQLLLIGSVVATALVSSLFVSSAQISVNPNTRQAGTTGSGTQPPVDALAVAQNHVRQNLATLRLVESDINEWVVSDRYATKHNGVTHVYFQQRLGGIGVLNGILNVNVTRDGRVLGLGNRFVPRLAETANTSVPQMTAEQAIHAAAGNLGLASVSAPLAVVQLPSGPEQQTSFTSQALSLVPIKAHLQYLPVPGGARLVWDVELEPDSNHYWHVEVDAVSGSTIRKFNLVKNDSYKVYSWPAESPNHVRNLPLPPNDGRSIATQTAANSIASPFGWHDTNGMAGAETTDLTGNNVEAQTDEGNDDVFTPQTGEVRPSSATRDFIFPIDLTKDADTYREAAVTNLFYWNNVTHDLHYLYGFDEAAGNFQMNNYGRGGVGNDRVAADTQDGSGTNNANFLTLPEGTPPRMQMFIWTGATTLHVNSPGSIAGDYPAAAGAFGAELTAAGVTGDLQIVNSMVNPQGEQPSQGCNPMVPGSLSGKVAVIDRGSCEFGQKVVMAQNAGAIAAIIINNAGDDLVLMGPGNTGDAATISSVFIGQTNGTTIKNTIGLTTVNASMKKAAPDRDSDLDSAVIVHEYTHGVSTRLTGGPSNVLCLENLEQGGEGWSDWFAMAFTARTGDTGPQPRGMGTYVVFQDPPTFGGGIRPFPYSTSMTVNPQTYNAVRTAVVPHGVGAVWAEMLWEMYWNVVDGVPDLKLPGRGYRQNLYDVSQPLAGNQIAMRLVMDGLKLQACSPTFVEARDAILEADRVNNGGAFQCHIWKAFAKRGLGVNAIDGGKFPLDDNTVVQEDFTLPCECNLPSLTNFAAAANGGTATASSVYPGRDYMPTGAIDGERSGVNWEQNGGWNDGTRDAFPDSLEIAFNGSKTINQIRVYTVQNDFRNPEEPTLLTPADVYGIQDFDVQYWDGSNWVTVPNGHITNNSLAMNVLVFNEVTTTKIRVFVTNARTHFSRITEVEAFGCS
jgi:hypothetical protein